MSVTGQTRDESRRHQLSQELIRQIAEDSARAGIDLPEAVLRVIEMTPREFFIPRAMRSQAYENKALPIGYRQTISQPTIVAWMTALLDLRGGERVLEVGTGSGYQTYILSCLVGASGWIVSIERNARLARAAAQRLRMLGATNAVLLHADGSLGSQQGAPYDRIIITAGAPDIPSALIDQLAPAGRMVLPSGSRDAQELILVRKNPDGQVTMRVQCACRFVPLIGTAGWPD